jgi:hypothetical protein
MSEERAKVRTKRPRFVLGIALVVAAAAMFVAVPLATAVSGALPVATAKSNTVTATCSGDPSLSFSATTKPAHSTEVLAITWTAVNDEDSGYAGYWAMDTYSTTLTVWLLHQPAAGERYYYVQTFTGNFVVPQGGISPGATDGTPNMVTEPASGYGAIAGMWYGYISNNENFTPGMLSTRGTLGTLNYSGTMSDVLQGTYSSQTGDANSFNWESAYFTPGAPSDFTFGDGGDGWGFEYNLNSMFTGSSSVNQWCDFGTSTSGYGDIVTQAGTTPP